MSDSDKALRIQIILDLLGQGKVDEARQEIETIKQSSADLSKEMGVVTVSSGDVEKALGKTGEAAEKSHVSHRALHAVFSAIRQQSPELAEALENLHMIEAFGAVGAVAALIKAWEIYTTRITEATEAMSEVKMPDLTASITQAQQLGQQWNGIADAVKRANEEFDSVEKRNDRSKSADEKEHDRQKKQLELNKAQALANLDLESGAMTKPQYALNKSQIENFYAGKEAAEDERFEQRKLARKAQYADDLMAQAQKDAAAADQMKLPKTQEQFDAEQAALQERAKTFGETAAEHKKNAETVKDVQSTIGLGGVAELGAIPGALKHQMTYGWGTSGGKTIEEQEKMARDAEDEQNAVEREITARKKAWEKKKALQDKAGKEAGEGATAYDELHSRGGDIDQYNADSRWRQQTTQAHIVIDTTRAVSEATDHGQKVQGALDALHRAHVGVWVDVLEQLRKQATAIDVLQGQMGNGRMNISG